MRCVLRIDPAAETLEAALVLDRYRACSTLFMFVGRPRQVRVLGLSVILGEILLGAQFRVSLPPCARRAPGRDARAIATASPPAGALGSQGRVAIDGQGG